jgi:hypothetical protein
LLRLVVTYIDLQALRLTLMPFLRSSEYIRVEEALNEWLEHLVPFRVTWVQFSVVCLRCVLYEGILGQDILHLLRFIHVSFSHAFCIIPASLHNYLSPVFIFTVLSYRHPRARMSKM